MSHTPFGYRVKNGKAVIDKAAAEQVKTLFRSYLSGDSLDTAAKKAGIKSFHAGIGRILHNTCYLGNEYYPAIIDPDTFAAAQTERTKRAEKLGRIREPKDKKDVVYPTAFYVREGTQQFDGPGRMGEQAAMLQASPFEQAEYAYSLIETEVEDNGGQ